MANLTVVPNDPIDSNDPIYLNDPNDLIDPNDPNDLNDPNDWMTGCFADDSVATNNRFEANRIIE